MDDGYTPERLAGRIKLRQPRPFLVGDAQRGESAGIGGDAVAVNVQICLAAGDAQQLDYTSIDRRHPLSFLQVVIARWHSSAYREVEKVFNINGQRFVEAHIRGACGDGLVQAEFGSIGITAAGRQFRRHGLRARIADGVFGGADVERGQRHGDPIRQHHVGSGVRREEDGGAAGAILVADGAAARYLHGRAIKVDRGHGAIQRNQDDIGQPGIVAPGSADRALGGEEAVLFVTDGKLSATVDGHVKQSAGARQRLSKFRMTEHADTYTGEGGVVAVHDFAAQHRHPVCVHCAGDHAGLDGVVA
jgi:hypothetical protein